MLWEQSHIYCKEEKKNAGKWPLALLSSSSIGHFNGFISKGHVMLLLICSMCLVSNFLWFLQCSLLLIVVAYSSCTPSPKVKTWHYRLVQLDRRILNAATAMRTIEIRSIICFIVTFSIYMIEYYGQCLQTNQLWISQFIIMRQARIGRKGWSIILLAALECRCMRTICMHHINDARAK